VYDKKEKIQLRVGKLDFFDLAGKELEKE